MKQLQLSMRMYITGTNAQTSKDQSKPYVAKSVFVETGSFVFFQYAHKITNMR